MIRRCLLTSIVGLLLPCASLAGPLMPVRFLDSSEAGAHVAGTFRIPDTGNAENICAGTPIVCESDPTAATQSHFRTTADAFTDGFGGSGLHLRSSEGHVEAMAQTFEEGEFDAGVDPVDVHLQGFFPLISLFGVFAPGSELAYDIAVAVDHDVLFQTHGALTDAGFTATGDDIGGVFDARHHAVFIPAFFLDLTTRQDHVFNLTVTKTLTFTGPDWVEAADAQMTDPEDVSAPGILRNGVTAVATDVPEPASLSLLAGAAAAMAARRRR